MIQEMNRPHLTQVNNAAKSTSEPQSQNPDPLKLVTRDMVLQGETLAVSFVEERMTSIISATTKSTGNIVSSEGYRVDGTHDGDIQATTVFVTENATVNGKITANRVIVQGIVRGEIRAAKELIFASTADVIGKIHYRDIVSFRGHRFEGQVFRIK